MLATPGILEDHELHFYLATAVAKNALVFKYLTCGYGAKHVIRNAKRFGTPFGKFSSATTVQAQRLSTQLALKWYTKHQNRHISKMEKTADSLLTQLLIAGKQQSAKTRNNRY